MTEYLQFVKQLESDYKVFLRSKDDWEEKANIYVNGFASDELRRLVSLEKRREFGAFFTDNKLAKKVLNFMKPEITEESCVYDPACGAGNLLIALIEYIQALDIDLPWKNLLGSDLHIEFVNASKVRLAIKYLLENNSNKLSKRQNRRLDKSFAIIRADGLKDNSFYKKATHVFVNPPFNQTNVYDKVEWATGKVSLAALFIDKIIQYTKPGTTIIAILPDVLRSGTRYKKWRSMIEEKCTIEDKILLGQFDKYADIDVYAVKLIKREGQVSLDKISKVVSSKKKSEPKTLSDFFDICVGPVVDYRDKHTGKSYPYIVSKGLSGWSEQKETGLKRRFSGRTFRGPFVVVKRTSRYTDVKRAVATVINISSQVIVDNHLIVLLPKSGKLADCKKALEVLNDTRTNKWLNEEIRCRHLTVKAVRNIPIWNKKVSQ